MVATLLLINPIDEPTGKRGVKKMAKAKRKKKFSPAQIANQKRFAAAARARAGKKHASPKKRKSAKRSHVKSRTVVRKRKNVVHHVAGYYPNPVGKKHMKKRRKNPISKMGLPSVKSVKNDMLIPAAIGAVGAIVVDMVAGHLPLPASMKIGNMKYVTKAVTIIGLGALASAVVGKKRADLAVAGGLTVMFYGLAKDFMVQKFPAMMPLGDMGLYSAGLLSGEDEAMLNEYMPSRGMAGMGEYMTADGMGEFDYGGEQNTNY